MPDLHGAFPCLVSPIDAAGHIREDVLGHLCDDLIEFACLDADQRKAVETALGDVA
jgi:hypothetical protein